MVLCMVLCIVLCMVLCIVYCIVYDIVYCIVYGIVYVGMGWRNKALAFSATLTFSQRQQKKLLLRMPALINLLPG